MLDLADEIISYAKSQNDCHILRKTIDHVVNFGLECVKEGIKYSKEANFDDNDDGGIRKVLLLLNQISSPHNETCRHSIVIARELLKLLEAKSQVENSEMNLLRLMADVVDPQHCFEAMSLWLPNHDSITTKSIIPILKRCLIRGPQSMEEGQHEISKALHRVRNLRFKETRQQITVSDNNAISDMTIWEQMEQGIAMIDK
jgi:ankyrin repeat protein